MSQPNDQSDRGRFAEELDRNFSVIASAGSGKTRAITDRILEIARARNAVEILPKLVVVTFTNRAADEMQQRTRQQILEEKLSPEVVIAFNRAFFGTIHAFCMKLLTNYGHYLGLPTPLELMTDDENLWQEFVQQQTRLGGNLSKENRAALFRLAQARDIMELGRRAGSALLRPGEIGPCPEIDFREVHAAPAKGSGQANIINSKAELADWEERYNSDWEFLRWPICSTSAKDFSTRWREAFGPLRKWINQTALCVAAEVQRDYRDFRLERGVVTYADQIALADELLQHPLAARRVREQNFRVILDEAQDTDPAQFSVLLELTRPPEAEGRWLVAGIADPGCPGRGHALDQPGSPTPATTMPPHPGHFCMVGDLQQSIYGERADLKNYRKVHDSLVQNGAAAELTFSVTFRLDQGQIDFLNRTFGEILNNLDGQVPFVELQPRPEVLPGQVISVSLGAGLLPSGPKKLKDYQKARIEADELARWIQETGFEKLRAASWREVAILCPRKAWLRTMAAASRKLGLPVAIQSESAVKADSPAHAWLTALSAIMVDPLNAYEIVGVLREVFGISDHDLAVFSEGDGSRFRIDRPASAAGIISTRLRMLAETRASLDGQALFDAVTALVRQTQLRERLAALPFEEFGDLSAELDSLLASAAEAEANGATLAEFAEKLRADFETPREVRLSSDDAIQLITSQKAKGSEWQAVIIPFLGRDIRVPPPRYPSLIKTPGSGEIIVALSKEDPPEELKKARELSERQEMERLLYVATTRARHTLVLALDGELFLDAKSQLSKRAQLKLLHGEANGKNLAHFQALSNAAQACEKTSDRRLRIPTEEPLSQPLPPVDQQTLKKAEARAGDFVRKFNPSAYDAGVVRAADEEILFAASRTTQPRSGADNLATLYGRWWHSLFEAVTWSEGVEEAEQLYQERRAQSPDQPRSIAEWKLARKLFAHPILAAFAARKGTHAHAEFVFAWSIKKDAAIEGVIDLLLIDQNAGECLLLDWKTNRVEKGAEDSLRLHYRPQIAAYWKAVSEITRFKVDAGLYSTAAGKLVMFELAELEAEWARLATLPSEQMRVEITPEEL